MFTEAWYNALSNVFARLGPIEEELWLPRTKELDQHWG